MAIYCSAYKDKAPSLIKCMANVRDIAARGGHWMGYNSPFGHLTEMDLLDSKIHLLMKTSQSEPLAFLLPKIIPGYHVTLSFLSNSFPGYLYADFHCTISNQVLSLHKKE